MESDHPFFVLAIIESATATGIALSNGHRETGFGVLVLELAKR